MMDLSFIFASKIFMRKKYRVHLTKAERLILEEIIARRSSKSVQVKRAYILLAADENGEKCWLDKQIKDVYGVSISTIERLRKRFIEDGFEIALNGKPRPINLEKVLDGQVEANLVALRCSETPEGSNKWTLRLLADKMVELEYVETISHESVRQILKKTKLSLGR